MNILILTGRFGMGHYSAAISLKQKIQKEMSDANIEIIDIIEYITPKLREMIYSGFSLIVKKANKLYNFVYKNTVDFEMTIPFVNIFVNKIEKLINQNKPDIVISTLPFCSRIVAEYKEKNESNLPLITCITDVSIHNEWLSKQTDLYLVATETVKNNLIKNGVKSENIVVSGIPVKEQFKSLCTDKSRSDKKIKNLLIMGGGLGLIPLNDKFYYTLNQVDNLKVTVITGNNKKFYNKLYGKYKNIEVIGYTDRVHEYMAKSDLIISKAGGITLFEAIHAQLPLLVICPFLEQEKNNAYFIEDRGIGEILWDKSEDVAFAALNILYDEEKLSLMRKNMNYIKSTLDNSSILDIVDKIKIYEVA